MMTQKTMFHCTAAARERARVAAETPGPETENAAAACPACDLQEMIKKQKLKDSQARSKNHG
jgi:hypothetical protein